MQWWRFLHDSQISHWGNVLVRLVSRNPVFIEYFERAINDIPLATMQTVCSSVLRHYWECTVVENKRFKTYLLRFLILREKFVSKLGIEPLISCFSYWDSANWTTRTHVTIQWQILLSFFLSKTPRLVNLYSLLH